MKPQFVFLFALPLLGFAVDEKLEYFESKIRPVLAEKCYECHSAQSGKTKGGLRLDHIEVIALRLVSACQETEEKRP